MPIGTWGRRTKELTVDVAEDILDGGDSFLPRAGSAVEVVPFVGLAKTALRIVGDAMLGGLSESLGLMDPARLPTLPVPILAGAATDAGCERAATGLRVAIVKLDGAAIDGGDV